MAKPLLAWLDEAKQEDSKKSLGYFAERTGIDKGYISRVARHIVKSEDPAIYEKLSKELHIRPEDITEYNQLKAAAKIQERPALADALINDRTADLVIKIGEAPEEERQEMARILEDYWAKRHGRKE